MAYFTEMLVNGISSLFSSAPENAMSAVAAPAFEYGMSTMADAPVVEVVSEVAANFTNATLSEAAEQVVANLTNATLSAAAEQVVANLTNATDVAAEAAAEVATQTWGEFAYDWAAYGLSLLTATGAAGTYAYLRNRGGNSDAQPEEKPMTQAEFQTLMGYNAEQMKGIDANAYGFAKVIQSFFCKTAFEELKKSQALLNTFKQPKTLDAIRSDEDLVTMCMQWLSNDVKHAQKALNAMPKDAQDRVKGFSDEAILVRELNRDAKQDKHPGKKNYQVLTKENAGKFLDAVEKLVAKGKAKAKA